MIEGTICFNRSVALPFGHAGQTVRRTATHYYALRTTQVARLMDQGQAKYDSNLLCHPVPQRGQ